jgi:hypothetical protein
MAQLMDVKSWHTPKQVCGARNSTTEFTVVWRTTRFDKQCMYYDGLAFVNNPYYMNEENARVEDGQVDRADLHFRGEFGHQ